MESEPYVSPKARHRFGFTGRKKIGTQPRDTLASKDEILDSLTRQAASQVGMGEQQTRTLEILAETEEPAPLSELPTSTIGEFKQVGNRRLGHYAIVAMAALGMIIVWIYNPGRSIVDSGFLTSIVQRATVQSVYSNPEQLGIISLVATTIAIWLAARRRSSRRLLHL